MFVCDAVCAFPVQSHGVQGAEVREQDIDADVIVLATGFQSQQFCAGIDIRGVTGRPLADTWADEPFAYYGMLVPDFPNVRPVMLPQTQ